MSGFGAPLGGPASRPPHVKHMWSRQENILMNIIMGADKGMFKK